MKTRISILLLCAGMLFSLACSRKNSQGKAGIQEDRTVVIRGRFEGGGKRKIVLEELAAREYIPVDTVSCDARGGFEISFEASAPAFYALRNGPDGYLTLFCEPGENLEITGTYARTDAYTVRGSEGSRLLMELSAAHRQALDALSEITRKNRDLVHEPGYPEIKARLDREFDSITDAFRRYSIDFIRDNPESPSILIALYNMYGPGLPVFRPERDLQVYRFVDSVLMSRYPDMEAVQLLHGQVGQAEELLRSGVQERVLKEGEIAPDFVSSTPDGKLISLSDLRGNYVLLSFWAGWSDPSRTENRYIKEVQERFGGENFRILQVSLDDRKEEWTAAIREDRLDWLHVSDLNRWESPLAELYHLERIPANVLIDPEGKIIGTDLFGDRLKEKLERVLRNP